MRAAEDLSRVSSQVSSPPACLPQAYRSLALRHHPDKAGGDAADFARLSAAFRTLSDPKLRRTYDLLAGETAFRPGGASGARVRRLAAPLRAAAAAQAAGLPPLPAPVSGSCRVTMASTPHPRPHPDLHAHTRHATLRAAGRGRPAAGAGGRAGAGRRGRRRGRRGVRTGGAGVRDVRAAGKQPLLDLQHGHLRTVHPPAALEGGRAWRWRAGRHAQPRPAEAGTVAAPCAAWRAQAPHAHRAHHSVQCKRRRRAPPRCAQGEWQLHWPLVNSPALRERLARRELELKRQEDADRWV
jgi:curved DNA-binding protein CbpA